MCPPDVTLNIIVEGDYKAATHGKPRKHDDGTDGICQSAEDRMLDFPTSHLHAFEQLQIIHKL
jgi:hypothetical protein